MLPNAASILAEMKEINLMAFTHVLEGLIDYDIDEDWLDGIFDAVQEIHSTTSMDS